MSTKFKKYNSQAQYLREKNLLIVANFFMLMLLWWSRWYAKWLKFPYIHSVWIRLKTVHLIFAWEMWQINALALNFYACPRNLAQNLSPFTFKNKYTWPVTHLFLTILMVLIPSAAAIWITACPAPLLAAFCITVSPIKIRCQQRNCQRRNY